MEVAALRPGERVLDVACGTGVLARLAAQAVGVTGGVTGLDVNPGMLAVAASTTPAGVAIDWREATAEAMPLADASFDAVVCQMGLQFMPDKHAALSEMRRVLVRGGRLILSVPGPTPRLFVTLGEALTRHVGAEAGGFVNHVFSLHDAAQLRELLEGAGWRDVSVEARVQWLPLPAPEEFFGQYVASTPLAGVVAQVSGERREALERDVVAEWRESVDDRGFVLEARIAVATAQK